MTNLPITIPAFVPVVLEILVAVLSGCFVALSVSLVVWTFRDIRSRSRDLLVQLLSALLVLVFNVFGLLLYRLLRPRETLAEAYDRALEEEALLQDIEERQSCPSCRQSVKADYMVCPNCHTPLKKACAECHRLLNLRWGVCPYCGAEATPGPDAHQAAPKAAVSEAR